MATESPGIAEEPLLFWHDGLEPNNYIDVTYLVESIFSPKLVAASIALEQSVSGLYCPPGESPDFETRTGRVRSFSVVGPADKGVCPYYHLDTAAYGKHSAETGDPMRIRVEISFPVKNLGQGVTSVLNSFVGEIPRLGILSSVRIESLEFPESFLSGFLGPRYGVPGLRKKWSVQGRPFLCRSARPAVGLANSTTADVFGEVLRGGFDFVKDDELTTDEGTADYQDRLDSVLSEISLVEDQAKEPKGYIANLIDDPDASLDRLRIAERCGAHGLLIAPGLQGLGFLKDLRSRTELFLLAHNTGLDEEIRSERFGVHPAVHILLQRLCGADMVMMPGTVATDYQNDDEIARCLDAALDPIGDLLPALPIIAGGKKSSEMDSYIKSMNGIDFCMIIATAVDEYPGGLYEGAALFRQAVSPK